MNTLLRKSSAIIALVWIFSSIITLPKETFAGSSEIMYPLKEISKLECRFEDFDSLSSNCKESLPVLNTKDYKRYAQKNWGYNDFTRLYTVLWGSSYKYGWDVWNGGHQGTDIATAKGTPVYSIADGKVITSKTDVSWGKHVSIEHTINGKKVISNYAHMSKIYVEKWDRISIGTKIGEVGSTGNSTGNHLHFQIDLPNSFHPYYYNWNACPYGYYEITEKWVCFNELAKNTIDPLKFLETNGAILDEEIEEQLAEEEVKTDSWNSNNSDTKSPSSNNIFNTTVYYDIGSSDDVKSIQRIYNKLGYYNGRISGDFEDIEESIIEYQIKTGVLQNRDEDGAGWFGPKTRTQTKKDYDAYVASGGQSILTVSRPAQKPKTTKSDKKIEVIERKNLMTREEREAKELGDFLNIHTVELWITSSTVGLWETQEAILSIKNTRGKWYRWNTPWVMSFDYDTNVVDIFPKEFYHFSNGEREIKITGKKSGTTEIKIKIWDKVIQTKSVVVGSKSASLNVEWAKIYSKTNLVLGENNKWVILLKDNYGNPMLKTEFKDKLNISSNTNVEFCVKSGAIQDIKSIYIRDCQDEEFKKSLSYGYNDTIGGLLVFEYRVLEEHDKLSLEVEKNGKKLSKTLAKVKLPNGLYSSYPYFNEIVSGIENSLTTGVKKWYFLEDRALTEDQAVSWLKNVALKNRDSDMYKALLNENIQLWTELNRKDFLALLETYMGWEEVSSVIQYKDLESEDEKRVAMVLWENYRWKDSFWQGYFQPEKILTRGEAAYMLSEAMQNSQSKQLARK